MKNYQKGFIIPLVIAAIIILSAVGGIYYYSQNKGISQLETQSTNDISNNNTSSNIQATTSLKQEDNKGVSVSSSPTSTPKTQIINSKPQISTSVSLGGLSPKEMYLKMLTYLDKTQTYDEFLEVSLKYADSRVRQQSEQDTTWKNMTITQKKNLFVFAKLLIPTFDSVKEVKQTITGNQATLTVTTNDPAQKITVVFVLEGGVWKLDSQNSDSGSSANKQNASEPVYAGPEYSLVAGPNWDWRINSSWKIFTDNNFKIQLRYPTPVSNTGISMAGVMAGGVKYTAGAGVVQYQSYYGTSNVRTDEVIEKDGSLGMRIYLTVSGHTDPVEVTLTSYQSTGISADIDPDGSKRLKKLSPGGVDFVYLRSIQSEILKTITYLP